MEERKYSYAELCRMKKKRVIRLAGYDNMKKLLADGFNKKMIDINPLTKQSMYENVNSSKKYIARLIAYDR